MNDLHQKLAKIQKELKAPKGQKNAFGNYNYRSCEDILEAVKPLLDGLTLRLPDEVVNIGERYYVKATAILSDGSNEIAVPAYAREPENKKGMDESQITGAASSYARKYALNGLFAIDDTKDADTMDNRPNGATAPKKSFPDDESEPVEKEPLKCLACGKSATVKSGEKNGKKWTGIFCSSGNKEHTKWSY